MGPSRGALESLGFLVKCLQPQRLILVLAMGAATQVYPQNWSSPDISWVLPSAAPLKFKGNQPHLPDLERMKWQQRTSVTQSAVT